MGNKREAMRFVSSIANVTNKNSPLRELPWVLKRIVDADVAQIENAEEISAGVEKMERVLMYAQRAVEMGYILSEMFVKNEYGNWFPRTEMPRIIDLGGDPGTFSALYWKHKAPKANITAVEANPVTASVMQDGLKRRGIEGIKVVNAAVTGESNGIATLHLHKPRKGWHTQDYVSQSSTTQAENGHAIQVPTIAASDLIGDQEKIDLLKIDIEGSEGDAIKDLSQSGKLKQIEMIIMEFHHDPIGNSQNSIEEMLRILEENDFTILAAHLTVGKGMRRKRKISTDRIARIASVQRKVFLTFSAVQQDQVSEPRVL
jgi:FkbM family methyltransferase